MLERIRISIKNSSDAIDFVSDLVNADYSSTLFLENEDGSCHVNAYSKLAAIYAASSFKKIYLVNTEEKGHFPLCVRERWIYEEN